MGHKLAEVAADYLEENAESLVSQWIDWVKERVQTTAISALPERALRNHIPPVLQGLGRYVRAPAELARQELLSHLRLHGQIRRDQGYTLKEVIAEFDGLADIVTSKVYEQVLEAASGESTDEALTVAERLAAGLRSVSYIAMGTFDDSDEERLTSIASKLEDFARTIAHELSSPLFALRVSLDKLGEMVEDREDAVGRIQVMTEAVAHCTSLVDSLTVLAIAERSRAGQRLITIDEAIDRMIKEHSGRATDHDVEVMREGDNSELRVERAVIELVLANLIGNAIKYSDPEKKERWVKIVASYVEEEHDSGFCEVTVSDNGIGVPIELLPRILQRGFRAHPEHAVGTGLGLHIVQQMLTERGGSIEVDSTEGEGTAVTIRIRCLLGDASALTADRFRVERLMGEAAINVSSESEEDPPKKPKKKAAKRAKKASRPKRKK